jgi:hypothetical protein
MFNVETALSGGVDADICAPYRLSRYSIASFPGAQIDDC